MAFSNASIARGLVSDDQLFLYTTRGCFGNPSRGVSRVIGHGNLTSPVVGLSSPVIIAGRLFRCECTIHVDSLTPFGEGVIFRDLVPRLDAFSKNPQTWSTRLRRSLLRLSFDDAKLIAGHLAIVARSPEEVIDPYLKWLPQKVDEGA